MEAGFVPGAHNLGVMSLLGMGLTANEAQGANSITKRPVGSSK